MAHTTKREIAFIDRNVDDLDTLLAGIRPDVETIVLSNDESAPRQMARVVQGREGLAAIHVIAHGRPGQVSFGAGVLSRETISEHADDLAVMGQALAPGVLALWSCETAAGQQGHSFVQALARITSTNIAATKDLVGSADCGGRWRIDAQSTTVPIDAPLSAQGIAKYRGVMVTNTWTAGTTGNWETAGNWSQGHVPLSSEDVSIPSGGLLSYVVTINSAAVANSVTITGGTVSQTTTLTLTSGNSLTTSQAISLSNGTAVLNGAGSVNAAGGISGSGTLQAGNSTTGGTLDVTGTISSGVVLAIGTAAASDLKIEGTATLAAAILISSANQTLEIGSAGSLTINAPQTVSAGTIKLDGGTLTDSSGLTISGGGTLTGFGTVAANIAAGSGTRTITSSGGTLTLSGTVASGPAFTINSSVASDLKFTNTATAASAITISSANQTLEIGTGGNLTINAAESITNGTILMTGGNLTDTSGLTIGSGATLNLMGSWGISNTPSITINSGGLLTTPENISWSGSFTILMAGGTYTAISTALNSSNTAISGFGTVNGSLSLELVRSPPVAARSI
jgi:hypothetical protein